MNKIIFFSIICFLLSEVLPSCGGARDPLNSKLVAEDTLALRKYIDSLKKEAAHLSILAIDTFYCQNQYWSNYGPVSCKAKFKAIKTIHGNPVQEETEYLVPNDIVFALTNRFLVTHDSVETLTEIPAYGPCYDHYHGTYISEGKLYNKDLSDSSFLPQSILISDSLYSQSLPIKVSYRSPNYIVQLWSGEVIVKDTIGPLPKIIMDEIIPFSSIVVAKIDRKKYDKMDFSSIQLIGIITYRTIDESLSLKNGIIKPEIRMLDFFTHDYLGKKLRRP